MKLRTDIHIKYIIIKVFKHFLFTFQDYESFYKIHAEEIA